MKEVTWSGVFAQLSMLVDDLRDHTNPVVEFKATEHKLESPPQKHYNAKRDD